MSNQTFPLVAAEAEELQQLEATIAGRLASFIAVGEALSKIREAKLYRASHATFEDYCRQRWGMSRYYAHRLIASAEVVEMLPAGNKSEIANERQARELAKVAPAERPLVIEKAKELSNGAKITAADLKAAANPAPVAPPVSPPAVSVPTAPEVAPAATEQPAAKVLAIAQAIVDALWAERVKRSMESPKRDLMKGDARLIVYGILEKLFGREVSPAPKKKSAGGRKAINAMGDEEFILFLESQPHLHGVDVRREIGKCQLWAVGAGVTASRMRIVNWLNKADRPLTYNGTGKSSKPNGSHDPYKEPEGWRDTLRSRFKKYDRERLDELCRTEWDEVPLTIRTEIVNAK